MTSSIAAAEHRTDGWEPSTPDSDSMCRRYVRHRAAECTAFAAAAGGKVVATDSYVVTDYGRASGFFNGAVLLAPPRDWDLLLAELIRCSPAEAARCCSGGSGRRRTCARAAGHWKVIRRCCCARRPRCSRYPRRSLPDLWHSGIFSDFSRPLAERLGFVPIVRFTLWHRPRPTPTAGRTR